MDREIFSFAANPLSVGDEDRLSTSSQKLLETSRA
jgi:hypothetical protein